MYGLNRNFDPNIKSYVNNRKKPHKVLKRKSNR